MPRLDEPERADGRAPVQALEADLEAGVLFDIFEALELDPEQHIAVVDGALHRGFKALCATDGFDRGEQPGELVVDPLDPIGGGVIGLEATLAAVGRGDVHVEVHPA